LSSILGWRCVCIIAEPFKIGSDNFIGGVHDLVLNFQPSNPTYFDRANEQLEQRKSDFQRIKEAEEAVALERTESQ
jgi:hypothetical protein